MPGLVGIFGKEGGATTAAVALGTPSTAVLYDRPGRLLYVVRRAGKPICDDTATDEQSRFLAVYGHCLDATTGTLLTARELLARAKEREGRWYEDLDGAFVIAVFDPTIQRLTLINDRLGALPTYWCSTQEGFAFGPRIRLLGLPAAARRPDPTGVISFLGMGYCLGETTLVQDVRMLRPASELTVDLETFRPERRQYWDLVYRPDSAADPRELMRAMYDAIVAAVRDLTPAGPQSCGLFLSGGWDSRAILAAQLETGRPPAAVVTNGMSDQRPGTDTHLAKRLAADHSLAYRFNRRVPEEAVRWCLDGIQRCELITDTAPEVFGQHRLAGDVLDGLDCMFKGDEIWGWQDEAGDKTQAIGNVMPTGLSDRMLTLLADAHRDHAAATYAGEIDRVLAGCDNEAWNDIKDYLYLRGRVARYIFGVGSSDEEHLQVRRPLLAPRVLEVVSRTPSRLRIQKNLFLEMLARHAPRLFRYRRNHFSHIADYYRYLAPLVRERLAQYSERGFDLDGIFAPERYGEAAPTFGGGNHAAGEPSLVGRGKNALLDRWGHRWYRSDTYRRRSQAGFAQWSATDRAVLFRTWLLLEYFHGGDAAMPEV